MTASIPHVLAPYNQPLAVPVQVTDTSGKGIISAEVFVCFDSNLLTVSSTGVSPTAMTAGWTIESNVVSGAGGIDSLKIALATDTAELVGAGDLLTLHFTVADVRVPASSPLSLEHVLFNDGTLQVASVNGSATLVGADGTIASAPPQVIPRETITLTVVDADLDLDGLPDTDQVAVTVENTATGDAVNLILAEDAALAATFAGSVDTQFGTAAQVDGLIQAQAGDAVVSTYTDALDSNGSGPTDRTASTAVIGGTDGSAAITLVSQPGDPLYIEVSDADLNTNAGSAETVNVTVENSLTLESLSVVLTEVDDDDAVFFGALATTPGASGAGTMHTAEEDVVTITYDDVVTAVGSQVDRTAADEVIEPWGDADDNEQLQAFDAAQVLLDVLGGGAHLTGLERLAANVDLQPVTTGINPFDAALILQKRVGLIAAFPVQDPTSENHPQAAPASPKAAPDQRLLTLQWGQGYLSLLASQRSALLAGDLVLQGVQGRVEMATELGEFLSASRQRGEQMHIVFAGARAVEGPGELLRIYGVGSSSVQLVRAAFNNGAIEGVATELAAPIRIPKTFALLPNNPNPFNPETQIRFDLPRASRAQLEIFDALGQQVKTLAAGHLPAGSHRVLWDGRDEAGQRVSSGVYFYRLQTPDFHQTRRMILVK